MSNLSQVDAAIERIRDWLEACSHTNKVIASMAKLDEKSVRNAKATKWDPRASTLRKFEAVVPKDWRRRRKAS